MKKAIIETEQTWKEKEIKWKSKYEEDIKTLNEKLNLHADKIETTRISLKEGSGIYLVFGDEEDEDESR